MTGKMLVTVGTALAVAVMVGCGVTLAQPRPSLDEADRKFVMEAAEGSQMEVELGQLAQEKASNEAVRQFGQRMATDHAKAAQDLARLAADRGVELPSRASRKTQAEKDRLSKVSGSAFDREYVALMVRDHEKDVAAFRRHRQQGRDVEVKAWAARTLPTLEDHLKTIKQIELQMAKT